LCGFQWLQGKRNEFSESLYARDFTSGQTLAQRDWIVNEVSFAKTHAHNAATHEGLAQSAHNSFDFRKFRHGM
jgi:hypothetical protein